MYRLAAFLFVWIVAIAPAQAAIVFNTHPPDPGSVAFDVLAVDPSDPSSPIPLEIIQLSLQSVAPSDPSLQFLARTADSGMTAIVAVMGVPPDDDMPISFSFDFSLHAHPRAGVPPDDSMPADPVLGVPPDDSKFDYFFKSHISGVGTLNYQAHFAAGEGLAFSDVHLGSVIFDLTATGDPVDGAPLFTISLTAQLEPVPEPGSFTLLAGLVAVSGFAVTRRKRRASECKAP